MEKIVEELKRLRAEKNMTLMELAKRMNVERARLSEVENGRGGLTLKRLYQWANALGYKVTIKLEENE